MSTRAWPHVRVAKPLATGAANTETASAERQA